MAGVAGLEPTAVGVTARCACLWRLTPAFKECGGEGGIRTHGRFPYAGFQDQILRPLGHLSLSADRNFDKNLL